MYTCNDCDFISQSKEDLKTHELNHCTLSCEICKDDFDQTEHLNEHLLVCKAQFESNSEATTIEIYNDKQESPITILVNIPQEENQESSALKSFDISSCEVHSVVEIPCEIQTVQVQTNQVSPLSLLLSAAASESKTSDRFGSAALKFDLPEESSRPLDLSVSAQVSKNPESDILEFTSVNSGRRRSVFLVEELDYEHQGEMTVVDPLKVTGVNKN